jgi:hypothetical protein
MQGRYWSFTIFTDDLTVIEAISWGTWGVAQYEVAPTEGTLHIQGFCEFPTNMRLSAVCSLAASLPAAIRGSHWEVKLSKYVDDQVAYCTADDAQKQAIKNREKRQKGEPEDAPLAGGRVFGTQVHYWGERPVRRQGKRSDLDDLGDFVKANSSGSSSRRMKEIAQRFPGCVIKYHSGIEKLVTLTANVPPPKQLSSLRLWQAELFRVLDSPADDRTVWWFHDQEGGTGKSTFVSWMYDKYPDEVLFLAGGHKDMAYLYHGERIVFFDIPRSSGQQWAEHLYSFGEALKNGVLISTKYQSEVKRFVPPHVVFFANFPLEHGKFSADRPKIVDRFASTLVPVQGGLPIVPPGALPNVAEIGTVGNPRRLVDVPFHAATILVPE